MGSPHGWSRPVPPHRPMRRSRAATKTHAGQSAHTTTHIRSTLRTQARSGRAPRARSAPPASFRFVTPPRPYSASDNRTRSNEMRATSVARRRDAPSCPRQAGKGAADFRCLRDRQSGCPDPGGPDYRWSSDEALSSPLPQSRESGSVGSRDHGSCDPGRMARGGRRASGSYSDDSPPCSSRQVSHSAAARRTSQLAPVLVIRASVRPNGLPWRACSPSTSTLFAVALKFPSPSLSTSQGPGHSFHARGGPAR
jgi:hypothetical protein